MTSKIPVPTETVLVDTVEKCAAMCASIFEAKSTTDPKSTSAASENVSRKRDRDADDGGANTAPVKKSLDYIAVDLEGISLGRTGSICIVTIATWQCVYLVDICTLQKTAFEKGGLKNLFESTDVVKLMFDCRADADALYHLYGVAPKNVCDLQVMTTLYYSPTGQFLMGLKKSLERLQVMKPEESRVKDEGCILFDPEKGGSYEVWEKRPLDPLLVRYCSVDVKYFFTLYASFKQYTRHALQVGEQRVKLIMTAERPPKEQRRFRDFRLSSVAPATK